MSVLLLAGCAAAGPARQSATFQNYEVRDTGRTQKPLFGDAPGLLAQNKVYEPTGNAFVLLANGTRVKANCPIQGLKEKDAVGVQQNSDGTWVVVGKL